MSHLPQLHHPRTPLARAGLALGLAFSAAACGDPTGSRAHAVSLSFSTAAPATVAASLALPLRADVSASSGGNTLVVSKAQLVLSRIELAGSAEATCAGTGHEGECDEMKLGPVLVDLPLAGGVASAISAAVPAGSYAELEAKIDAVRDGEEGAAAFLAAHPELRGVSVRVEGTYNGQPFVYTGSGEASLELAFSPPVTVGASGVNLTVHVDVAGWFTDGSGNVIDPATAGAGGANASLVEGNIHRSFHAFEDDDRDGRDD